MKRIPVLFTILIAYSAIAQPQYTTTIHPFAVILKNVIGDRGTVNTLLPAGASPHTYELRPSDMRAVEKSTALFYGAENLDGWATTFPINQKISFLSLLPQEFILMINGRHDHHHSASSGNHDREKANDPHFWSDPLAVKTLLTPLAEKLGQLDPGGKMIYQQQAIRFSEALDSLDATLHHILSPIKGRSIMLSHPFYQYFLNRYEIKIAAVIETSPGKEPTPRELKKLIDIATENQVKAVCTHPQLPDRAARLVSESTGIPLVELDPIGGVPGCMTYREIILNNAGLLLEVLQ